MHEIIKPICLIALIRFIENTKLNAFHKLFWIQPGLWYESVRTIAFWYSKLAFRSIENNLFITLTPWLPVYEYIVLGNRPKIKHNLVVLLTAYLLRG